VTDYRITSVNQFDNIENQSNIRRQRKKANIKRDHGGRKTQERWGGKKSERVKKNGIAGNYQ